MNSNRLVAAVVVFLAWLPAGASAQPTQSAPAAPSAAPAQAARALAVRAGAPDGRLQLTVFCNIENEACARLVTVLRHVRDAHPDEVGITYRHVAPAERRQSALAYRAALAAARQAKGWEMLDIASANRDRLHDDGLLSMARQLGLDLDRFVADTALEEVAQVLDDDAGAAKELGVANIPALFLNGTRQPDKFTFEAIEAALK